jgi:hypothetical protein
MEGMKTGANMLVTVLVTVVVTDSRSNSAYRYYDSRDSGDSVASGDSGNIIE